MICEADRYTAKQVAKKMYTKLESREVADVNRRKVMDHIYNADCAVLTKQL